MTWIWLVLAIIGLVLANRLILWFRLKSIGNHVVFEHDSVQLQADESLGRTGITPGGQSWYAG